MNIQRLEQLRSLLAEEPNDPFLQYAIATEIKDEQPTEALNAFRILLQQHPEYLPTYYQAAGLMVEEGMVKEAKATYELGLRKSLDKDPHTHAELKAALDMLRLLED